MDSMLSSLQLYEQNLCPICIESFIVPRCLPGCGHSFCERCLFTFVFSLKEKGQLTEYFECPVCRRACPMPETQSITIEWIKTFPVNESAAVAAAIFSSTDTHSLEETRQICGPCKEEGLENPSKKYCIDCCSYICDDCVSAHRKFKELKIHRLTHRDDRATYQSDAHYCTKCAQHPDRTAELFCKDEEMLICIKCADTTHQKCTNVELDEIEKEISDKTSELRNMIENAHNFFKKLQVTLEKTFTGIDKKLLQIEKDVQDISGKMIISLKAIVAKSDIEISNMRKEMTDQKVKKSTEIEGMIQMIDEKLKVLNTVQQNGSLSELYCCLERLTPELEELEEEIFTQESSLKCKDINWPILTHLEQLSESLESHKVPRIIVQQIEIDPPMYSGPGLAIRLKKYKVEELDKIAIDLTRNCSPTFSSISVREDGMILLCDKCEHISCGHLCLYDTHNQIQRHLKMQHPYCAVFTDRHTIAVTEPRSCALSVISVGHDMKIEKTFRCDRNPKGITALENGSVAISWNNPVAFSISDISSSEIKDLIHLTEDADGRQFKSFDFVAVDEERMHVIQPCSVDKAVYCFDFNGKPVFRYTCTTDTNLEFPKGVAVDKRSGDVYVCNSDSHSIHHLTATGSLISVITADSLRSPLAINLGKQRKTFWVSHDCPPYVEVHCYKQIPMASNK